MAISIAWGTKVITIPQADLTLISGSLYELNVDTFRLALKSLEDDEAGMPFPRTHNHNTQVTLGGVTLARTVEIINGYTVTFTPNSQWAVRLAAGNNNIADVLNVNQVQLRSNNSAGLITVTSGSGVTEQDKLDIADRVLDEALSGHATAGTAGKAITDIKTKTDGLPSGIPRGQALSNFAFVMIDGSNHVTPKAGLTVSGQIMKDGGGWASMSGSMSDKGNGVYAVDQLSASEMDAAVVVLRFTASGADAQIVTLLTQP